MREIADIIANHIKSEFPELTVEVEPFSRKIGWMIHCRRIFSIWKHVRIEVLPNHLELWELNNEDRPSTTLLWESPNTFEIIDKALKEL